MMLVVAKTLNAFVGIVPAESKTVTNAEAVQNGKNDSQENFIGTTSFEIKVLQGNERLKLSEKRRVGTSQERSKDARTRKISGRLLLPLIATTRSPRCEEHPTGLITR